MVWIRRKCDAISGRVRECAARSRAGYVLVIVATGTSCSRVKAMAGGVAALKFEGSAGSLRPNN